MRVRAEEKHPRVVLEQRLASAEREVTTKQESLVRVIARGVGVEHAEQEVRRVTRTRDAIAAEIVALDRQALEQRKESDNDDDK